jgi:SPP1 gp7 family putative phage head morphogenesis protein
MIKADLIIADKILTNGIQLFRLSAGERKKAVKLLERMRKELIANLADKDLSTYSKAKARALLAQSNEVINDYYTKIQSGLEETLTGLAQQQTGKTVQIFSEIGLNPSLPTQNMIKSIVSDALITGSPLSEWWERQSAGLQFSFAAQVRQSIAQGETIPQAIRRINPIMDVSKRNAFALVNTAVQQVANDARLNTFKQNDAFIKGVEQLSTLDSHTSDICMAYSGAQWDLDGDPLPGTTLPFNGGPPRHVNCRSVLVPITKSYRELGIDIDEPTPGLRASDEGPISVNTTFDEFLSRKSVEEQDEMLGKGRAQLFRDGKITLRDLLDQSGNPLTLKELEKL